MATGSTPLIPEQRQQLLLRMLRDEGVLSTRQLTESLDVSHMTVRRDIAALESAGQVIPVAGGVRIAEDLKREPPRERVARSALELESKGAIAALAAEQVTDGMMVFLDAGTTCEAVIDHIIHRTGLTVVTSDFHTLNTLAAHPAIEVIHTGGTLDRDRSAANGPLAAATIRRLGIDLYLMSAGTWNVTHGVTVPVADTALLKQAALDVSARTILLADSSKFGGFERYRVCPLKNLDAVITDRKLPQADRASVEASGLDILIAE